MVQQFLQYKYKAPRDNCGRVHALHELALTSKKVSEGIPVMIAHGIQANQTMCWCKKVARVGDGNLYAQSAPLPKCNRRALQAASLFRPRLPTGLVVRLDLYMKAPAIRLGGVSAVIHSHGMYY